MTVLVLYKTHTVIFSWFGVAHAPHFTAQLAKCKSKPCKRFELLGLAWVAGLGFALLVGLVRKFVSPSKSNCYDISKLLMLVFLV